MPHKIIDVEITPSRMKAYVTVRPEEGFVPEGAQIWERLIEAELRASGVVFGIDRQAILQLVSQRRWGQKTLVASGVEPQAGEHGRVEYLFDLLRQPRPKPLEDGKVDYREIGLIRLVEQDELLARLIPATPGITGKTVEGLEMPAKPGFPAILQGGINTRFADPAHRELRAARAGSVSLARGLVQVDSTLAIAGNVDFASGNLSFTGDVIVRGDVKSGFRVRSDGCVEIHGIVEDAWVEAGGDVLVKGGFEGRGRGLIRAGGKVHLKFVENQTVIAGASIYIGETALNAKLEAGESIFLTSGRGALIGGHAKARQEITAKIFGNPQSALTTVEILYQDITPEIKGHKQQEAEAIREEIVKLQKTLESLQKIKVSEKTRAADLDPEIQKLLARIQPLKDAFDLKSAEVQELHSRTVNFRDSLRIFVLQKIYPGVRIIIGDQCQKILAVAGKTSFRQSEHEILAVEEVA